MHTSSKSSDHFSFRFSFVKFVKNVEMKNWIDEGKGFLNLRSLSQNLSQVISKSPLMKSNISPLPNSSYLLLYKCLNSQEILAS